MRVLYNNVIRNNTSITATNENPNFPIENIYHEFLESAFYATDFSSDIEITLDTDYDINCFAYGYHNFESTIDITFRNVLGVVIGTESITAQEGENIYYFSSVYEDVRTIEISITCLAGLLYLGGLSFGEYFDLGNFTQGIDGSFQVMGDSFTSPGGQTAGNRYRNLASYPVSFQNITNDKKNEIKNYIDFVGNCKPHFIDLYPNAHDYFNVFYGIANNTEMKLEKRPISDFEWNVNITFREAR